MLWPSIGKCSLKPKMSGFLDHKIVTACNVEAPKAERMLSISFEIPDPGPFAAC